MNLAVGKAFEKQVKETGSSSDVSSRSYEDEGIEFESNA